LLDEFGQPILLLRSGPFSVDTLVHAEQFLGLDGEGSITAPAAVRDSSHGRPNRRCASKLAGNLLHHGVAGFVSRARRKRLLMCHDGTRSFIQTQQLPANRFVARATAADLPNSHYSVVFLGEANCVDLDRSGVAVIAKFKNMA
jgi:hypothetical protein